MFKDTQNQQSQSETFANQVLVKNVLAKAMPKFKFKKPQDDIDKAIQCFLTGGTGKFGKYFAVANALVYRTILTERNGTVQEVGQNVIALKIERQNETILIGNSSVLPLIGRTSAWGRESLNRSVTEVQTRLSRYIPMIPFSVFTEAGLNLNKLHILERGPEMTVTRTEEKYDSKKRKNVKFDVEVHFTGASLFQVENKTFLFDIDQREIKHKIFNAFLVELTKPVKTIAEAYHSLKPKEVLEAEKAGLEVKRQGEWFFIPVKGEFETVMHRPQWGNNKGKEVAMPLDLRAGNNRPNKVTQHAKVDKETFVSGRCEHSGREHATLILKGWFKAVPNTSVQSFTLTGDVD